MGDLISRIANFLGFYQQPQNDRQQDHPNRDNLQNQAAHQSLQINEPGHGAVNVRRGVLNTYPPPAKQNPQPAGTFSYLPEDYTKPKIPISGNSLADDTAATVKEFFTTEVLERRRTVDTHLKAFKQSLGKGTNDPLPACFVAWKNKIFPEWEEVPTEGAFYVEFCTRSDEASLLQAIYPNKNRCFLTPELITTGTHVNVLLKACLKYLWEKDDLKRTLKEKNMQLLDVEVRTRTIDAIWKELQSLPAEIDRFAEEIRILMKDISTALDVYVLKRTGSTGKKRGTGVLIQRVNIAVQPASEEELSGYLREVDVIAETSVLVTNQSQTFHWEGYGLKLHIPQGALPAGLQECRLLIKVGLSGSFEFPQNTSLVSAVYWLDSKPRCKFSKSLTVTIQHCVKPAHTSRLSFVHAKCSQTHLPYQFETVEEGVFSSESVYGYLQLNHFSLLAVVVLSVVSRVQQLLPPGAQLYKASLYYLRKAATQRDIHFVITMDLEAHTTHVHKEYTNKGATIGADLHIEFESSTISLQLPSDGVLKDGWKIIPLFDPRITKEEVDSFKPKQRIPSCQLTAGWTKENKPSQLIYKVILEGVRVPSNYFHIVLDGVPPDPLDSEPELLGLMNEVAAKIPSKWRDVGLQLGLDQGVLDGIGLNNPGDTNHCYSNVFTRWKNQNLITHPYTWSTIVQALQAPVVGEERLADDIKKKWT